MKIVCQTCGSENVMRDAWAVWDHENQCWELGSIFDHAHCDDCAGPTRLEEKAEDDNASATAV